MSCAGTGSNMTDIAATPPVALRRRFDVTSDSARARVRRRYRAESRFRYYGLIALIFTTIFLVVLSANIILRSEKRVRRPI